ncbi:urease accessory protein UreE [Novosphingobium sp. 9]|uniref:urease accessory protein UreE n=1 Tax=Novosphingobium sp. 9 TaxID=2025349 RepID=UPI0021B6CCFE|nr:urease accessory protein UreE [Novosphingobium sp. 9]
MRRIYSVEPASEEPCEDSVLLDFDRRNRRRIVLTSEAGRALLLDMPSAVHLRDGERLRIEDGSLVLVRAAAEALLEIGAEDSAALVRIAWHLGNRHLPTQLLPGPDGGTLRIRYDHVIEHMVLGLGGTCTRIEAPFDPEGGAYSGGGHSHSHDHDHDHAHDHGHHHHHA